MRMYSQILLSLIMLISIRIIQTIEPIHLHIGALFNTNDYQVVRLAIDEINQRTDELFNGKYQLNLIRNNSQVTNFVRIFARKLSFCFVSSAIRSMQLTRFSTRFFVDLNYYFLLERHVRMKRKLLFK